MNFMYQLSIRQRTYLNIFISCLGIIVIVSIISSDFTKLNALNDEKLHIAQLETSVLELRRAEKDFLARKSLSYVSEFEEKHDNIKQQISDMKSSLQVSDIDTRALADFAKQIETYKRLFIEISQHQKSIGLDHESGYYGTLRAAVHKIEDLIKQQQNDALLVQMLQLRRAEKDFMLRMDTKYLDKFTVLINNFSTQINAADINSQVKSQIQQALAKYKNDFNAFVQAYMTLGLNSQSGLKGQMRNSIHQTEQSLNTLLTQTTSAIKTKFENTLFNGITAIIIVILLLIIAAYFVSISITRPIDKLCQTIEKIRQTNDLSIRLDESGNDEISFLSKTFNQLQADFSDAIGYINATTAELDNTMAKLSQMTADTQNFMQEQHSQADMAATAATEMQTTVAEIAQNTESAASNAANTASLTNQGKQQVDQTVSVISELAEHLNNASSEINKLEDDSRTIGNIIEVIQGIAEQTNLLALNAAIESARAGEQGRGFAVVADEVRNLAMRTQESTKQIETTISQLQNRSSAIVSLIQTCLHNGETSVEQAQRANQMLEQIQGEISSISDMSTMIATAVEEQNVVTDEVNQNVVKIRDISDEIYKMSETNTHISQSINASITELHQSVDKFKV
ncbi:methyl-accepting chemotaxis protein [Catenovulum adriaticum]|uniref:Methyl-accepting chemotaxis protein n=1 Tax=Catenovulum adriaticum TaxID=2984846 RepID=A0ABY7AJK5_9ALTE|nr:methyl-accepting chemotaxis protein [Catenovulum sp. TS8]WAJ69407.1 methyl-accepting chemotaxis protein [Catenovulum sp. TS8]